MEYYLYPPFFIIEPHTSFDKAWEDLCRQLLCLEYRTHAIQANVPPDLGEDLFWEAEGILYQCKSVEDGRPSSINITQIKRSIDRAIKAQRNLGWRRYILCTNVILSKVKKQALMKYLPGIEFLGGGTWVDLCKKFHREVADRFRILVQISEERSLRALNEAYLQDYERSFETKNVAEILYLLIYSDRRKYLFKLPFYMESTIEDVLITLHNLFALPPPRKLVGIDVSITLDYSLSIDNQPIASYKKLSELSLNKQSLVTLWKTQVWYQPPYREERRFMERRSAANAWIESHVVSSNEAVNKAVLSYEEAVDIAITSFAQSLIEKPDKK